MDVLTRYLRWMNDFLALPRLAFGVKSVTAAPLEPGIYIIYDKDQPIYVGVAENLRKQLYAEQRMETDEETPFRKALFQLKNDISSKRELDRYISEHCSFQFEVVKDPIERTKLERISKTIISPPLNAHSDTN